MIDSRVITQIQFCIEELLISGSSFCDLNNAPAELFICYNRSEYPKIKGINFILAFRGPKIMNVKQKYY